MPAFDHLYFVVTGAATARRAPEILQRLTRLGPRIVTLLTPNALRVLAPREVTLALGENSPHRLVESYFDDTILPRPRDGVVLVAPCSFDSLNKLAFGIADNLALSLVAEAIGRGTPVHVALSLNPPLWAHPRAGQSATTLRSWGVDVIEPVPLGDGLTLAPTDVLIGAVERSLAKVPC